MKIAAVVCVTVMTVIQLTAVGVSADCKAVLPADRTDCGYPGIPRSECEGKGCCFDDTTVGAKWCFYPAKPCLSSPCLNGATCVDGATGYTCTCAPGYTGSNCATDNNECASSPCLNGATCVDGVDGYTCTCPSGYTGDKCASKVSECASSPCLNGATCVDGVNGYTCTCAPGYTGVNCETDINECASSPCLNGGTCIDGVNGFTCRCNEGIEGPTCNEPIRTTNWADSDTLCPCWFDKTKTDCRCCIPGGCQCGPDYVRQCVKCNSGNCGKPMPGRGWTLRPIGCTCSWDKSRTDCACCAPGGCQCGQANQHQCVQCGRGDLCGVFFWADWSTKFAIGGICPFNKTRTDCAICQENKDNVDICFCGETYFHQCHACGKPDQCGQRYP